MMSHDNPRFADPDYDPDRMSPIDDYDGPDLNWELRRESEMTIPEEQRYENLKQHLADCKRDHVEPDWFVGVIVDQHERIGTAEARNRVLEEALRASERLRSFDYMPWSLAGGPEECEHRVAKGIHCRRCDVETARAALEATPCTKQG